MSMEIDFYDVQNAIRDALSSERAQTEARIAEVRNQLEAELRELRDDVRALEDEARTELRGLARVLHSRTDHLA